MCDSSIDTRKHIEEVQYNIRTGVAYLEKLALYHDQSKLESPEKEMFDLYVMRLAGLVYGSDGYKAVLKEMGPALQHHYQSNLHHPEHYKDGISGMSLLVLFEMLADWRAASLRHAAGNFRESLEINKKRFGISSQLFDILENTARELGWLGPNA